MPARRAAWTRRRRGRVDSPVSVRGPVSGRAERSSGGARRLPAGGGGGSPRVALRGGRGPAAGGGGGGLAEDPLDRGDDPDLFAVVAPPRRDRARVALHARRVAAVDGGAGEAGADPARLDGRSGYAHEYPRRSAARLGRDHVENLDVEARDRGAPDHREARAAHSLVHVAERHRGVARTRGGGDHQSEEKGRGEGRGALAHGAGPAYSDFPTQEDDQGGPVQSTLGEFQETQAQEAFALQNSKLLKVSLNQVTIQSKLGAMVAYQGDVSFEHAGSGGMGRMLKKAVTGEGTKLMKMSGTGEVFLADTAQEIHLLKLENDAITCNGANVLAFDAGIEWDIKKVEGGVSSMMAGGLFNMHLSGSGWVAID